MKHIGFWRKLGVLVGVMAVTPALASELVVYKAEGIALTPGQTINASQPLTLKEGQRVTLLASNGAILNLTGPFNEIPRIKTTASADAGVMDALKMLVTAPKTRSGGLGTTRSLPKTALPEPWLIDVSRTGDYCLTTGKPLVFWRPSSQETSSITLRFGEDLWKARAQWPAGADRLTPPAVMPITDGGVYQVELDGLTNTAKLHLMPPSVNSHQAQTTWMEGKGCTAQIAALNKTNSLQ
ncbi:MAG: hypothetical protein H7839_22570 [Magnetococcus sp. YQC-5]